VISKWQLRRATPEALQRLALFLKLHNTDTMSHEQLVGLVHWRLTRADKKARGMGTGYYG